jgi:hypothetical protein
MKFYRGSNITLCMMPFSLFSTSPAKMKWKKRGFDFISKPFSIITAGIVLFPARFHHLKKFQKAQPTEL